MPPPWEDFHHLLFYYRPRRAEPAGRGAHFMGCFLRPIAPIFAQGFMASAAGAVLAAGAVFAAGAVSAAGAMIAGAARTIKNGQ
jgi:hypothetical protein